MQATISTFTFVLAAHSMMRMVLLVERARSKGEPQVQVKMDHIHQSC